MSQPNPIAQKIVIQEPEEPEPVARKLQIPNIFSANKTDLTHPPTAKKLPVLVLSEDREVLDQLQSAAVAAGVSLTLCSSITQLKNNWDTAAQIFIGQEHLPQIANLGLNLRSEVFIVSQTAEDALVHSAQIGAAVLMLPEQAQMLGPLLTKNNTADRQPNQGKIVAVIGVSGGLGASSLSCAMSFAAVNRFKTALVDLCPESGGIDLLLGLENDAGLRWEDLTQVSGFISTLEDQLPQLCGVTVLSTGRKTGEIPNQNAIQSCISALQRSHDLLILDLGTPGFGVLDQLNSKILNQTKQLWLVGADIKSVTASAIKISKYSSPDPLLAVRKSRTRKMSAHLISEMLGVGLAGQITEDNQLAKGALQAIPPGKTLLSKFGKQATQIFNKAAHWWTIQ